MRNDYKQTTAGHLINVASNDIQRFQMFARLVNYLWVAPLAAVATLLVGLHLVGAAFLAGFIVILLLIPLQARTCTVSCNIVSRHQVLI